MASDNLDGLSQKGIDIKSRLSQVMCPSKLKLLRHKMTNGTKVREGSKDCAIQGLEVV